MTELSKPELIYCDTNFFYDVYNKNINPDDFLRFKTYISENKIPVFYSSFTFLEITSHINSGKIELFEYYRDILKITQELCKDKILIHPCISLCKTLNLPDSDWKKEYEAVDNLNPIRDFICSCKDYSDCINKKTIVKTPGKIGTINITENIFSSMRDAQEQSWSLYMKACIENYLRPIRVTKSGRIVFDNESKSKLKKYLYSKQAEVDFVDNHFRALQSGVLIGQPNKDLIENIVSKLNAFYVFMKSTMLDIAENIPIDKNDLHDSHFFIYLGQYPTAVFITNEKFIKRISTSPQLSRVMNLNTFLRRIR